MSVFINIFEQHFITLNTFVNLSCVNETGEYE